MKKILFLCTGNSCRSQMAEGWGNSLQSENFIFFSAGTKKHNLNPYAVSVMQEVGIDISKQVPKTISELSSNDFDYIFTVCSDAHESCPVFPSGKTIHFGFDDPPRLTQNLQDENAILAVYRRVRDEIREMVIDIEKIISNHNK